MAMFFYGTGIATNLGFLYGNFKTWSQNLASTGHNWLVHIKLHNVTVSQVLHN